MKPTNKPKKAKSQPTTPLKLRDHVKAYVHARDISKGHAGNLGFALDHFAFFLKREPTIDDLQSDTVNSWLIFMLENGSKNGKLARESVANYRRCLLTIWRDLYDLELMEVAPRRIRPVKVVSESPKAWSNAELRRVLAEADKFHGCYHPSRVSKSHFWRAFVLTGYDSGLRLGDLLALETEHVKGKNRFEVRQHKTGQTILVKLRPETVEAIKETYPKNGICDRRRVFRDALSRRWVLVGFRQIIERAGLSTKHGTTKMLRRSGATAVEAINPGASSRHLGHLSVGVAAKHYLDKGLVDKAKPLVPSLIDGTCDSEDDDVQDAAPVATTAQMQDMLTKMLERVAAVPSQPVVAEVTTPANELAPFTLPLLEEFLATEVAKMSRSYMKATKSYLRQTFEALEMWRTSDFSGQRFKAYLAELVSKEGRTERTAKWFRYPLLRFLKWLAKRDDDTGRIAAECAGRLAIARASSPRPRNGGKRGAA
ncbi:MAG TPA: site-specific integrase [Pirellulales bacterium]|nr:site-specific integrase [Pirellulales bacterium]